MTLWAALLFLVAGAGAEPGWQKSLASAQELAKSSGRPVLMDFQAPWCYSCYYMEKHVFAGEPFTLAAGDLVLLKVDVDREEGRALKERYRVSFLPTFILTDAAGAELGRIVGEQKEEDFLARLQALKKTGPAVDPADAAVAALRQALAAGDYEKASKDAAALPAKLRKALSGRRDWAVLSARLELMKSLKKDEKKALEALKRLLDKDDSCELAYDIETAGELKPSRELLSREAKALEGLADKRLFVPAAQRCADFRTGVAALADLYEKLGEKGRRASLLGRAIAQLDGDGLAAGEDRNHDDNLRYFLDLAGDEARLAAWYKELIAAYPADYVYPYRLGKHLQENGHPAEALPWLKKADLLAYGANRLAVTRVRAQALVGLGRRDEALALLARDIKAGQAAFPKDAAGLEALRETLLKKTP